jgi:hypothetical protein
MGVRTVIFSYSYEEFPGADHAIHPDIDQKLVALPGIHTPLILLRRNFPIFFLGEKETFYWQS